MTPLFTSKRRFAGENFIFFLLFCLGIFLTCFGYLYELKVFFKYIYTILYEAILLIMSFLWYCFILPYKLSLKNKTYIQQSHRMADNITVEIAVFILFF